MNTLKKLEQLIYKKPYAGQLEECRRLVGALVNDEHRKESQNGEKAEAVNMPERP